MYHLSLFSGYEGFGLGLRLAGIPIRTVGYVEIDEYCQQLLQARIRDGYLDWAPIIRDIRCADFRPMAGLVDIITAGFPCQPHSFAGKRLGADDERNLWPDTLRTIGEVGPDYVLLENTPGILSNGYAGTVVRQLSEIGYDARWAVVSAADVGAPHRRERWWCLAHSVSPRWRRGRDEEVGDIGARQEGLAIDAGDSSGMGRTGTHSSTNIPHSNNGRCAGQWRPTQQERQAVERGQHTGTDGEDGPMADADCLDVQQNGCQRQEQPTHSCGWQVLESGLTGIGWWNAQSTLGRVVNGYPHRVAELKTLGNGIVPAVVREFLRR